MIVRQQNSLVRVLSVTFLLLCAMALWSACAQASPSGTGWEATSTVSPTNLPPGGTGQIQIDIMNTGALLSSGSITVTDTLPSGLIATSVGGMPESGTSVFSQQEEEMQFGGARWVCTGTTTITCMSNPIYLQPLPRGRGSEAELPERIGIQVKVAPDASGTLPNLITVAGGGATSEARVSDPLTVSLLCPGLGFLSGMFGSQTRMGLPIRKRDRIRTRRRL